jgi:hypothetical protein
LARFASSANEAYNIPFTGYINPFGAVRQLGGSPNTASAVQLGALVIAALLVALVWGRRLPLPIRAAALASAALVAAPLALFYELILAAMASFWLLSPERRDALDPEAHRRTISQCFTGQRPSKPLRCLPSP